MSINLVELSKEEIMWKTFILNHKYNSIYLKSMGIFPRAQYDFCWLLNLKLILLDLVYITVIHGLKYCDYIHMISAKISGKDLINISKNNSVN